jgi:hypothetical protein
MWRKVAKEVVMTNDGVGINSFTRDGAPAFPTAPQLQCDEIALYTALNNLSPSICAAEPFSPLLARGEIPKRSTHQAHYAAKHASPSAMKITRKFTVAGRDPFASTNWVTRSSRITNPDGSVVFEMKDAQMPEGWSQLATDIMVSKYFRKAGVPQFEDPFGLPGVSPVKMENGKPVTGPERSAKQVIHRLAGCWRFWGEMYGYFDTQEDAQAFYDELAYMMTHQM